jgi:tetratricopeptide (TPR) repeat protein
MGIAQVANGEFLEAKELAEKLLNSNKERYIFSGLEILFKVNFVQGNFSNCNDNLKQFNLMLNSLKTRNETGEEQTYLNMLVEYKMATYQDSEIFINLKKLHELLLNKHSVEHPRIQQYFMKKANYLSTINQQKEAIKLAQTSFSLWLKYIDIIEPQTEIMALSYSEILLKSHRHAQAIKLLKKHSKTLETSLGENHHQTVYAYCLMGKALIQLGEKIKGMEMKDKALMKLTTILSVNSPLVKDCQD